ncbi:putative capsid protein [Grasshopper associated circular virus 1]|uniref:Putative capsid protein n=1 Tax=Grasshopper associated circular virus 1 TaxID=2293293 RepID=A0A346BP63_9VIRU|nr:putative capsid protein [Grasshopper associated circular virus 1]AXL65860.1 putative capsid protein [Grasshopper associated circular virus 1]
MAYRRSTRRYAARRRPTRKRSYPSRRRYTGKRRSTSRKMTTKRVLNVTSRKKQDTMQNLTNYSAASVSGGTQFYSDNTIISGGTLFASLWCPTARTNHAQLQAKDQPEILGGLFDKATRTASTCYMRGLKEKIQIQTNTGVAWQWRRICFTAKGGSYYNGMTDNAKLVAFAGTGWARVTSNWLFSDPSKQALFGPLFRGQEGVDWRNYFSAPLDTHRMNVKYDKTVIIQSGNDSGVMRNYSRSPWTPTA